MFIELSEKSSGLARYINDSFNKPNCVAKIYRCKNGLPHVMLEALQDIEVDIELVYRYRPWGIPRPWLDEQTDWIQSNDASAAPVETRVGQAVELESQLTEPEKMRGARRFLKDWYDCEKTRDNL